MSPARFQVAPVPGRYFLNSRRNQSPGSGLPRLALTASNPPRRVRLAYRAALPLVVAALFAAPSIAAKPYNSGLTGLCRIRY